MAFLAEAKTSEQVADVLQRVVTLHNKRMSILGWREVWKGIASTDHGKGIPEECFQDINRSLSATQRLLSKENAGILPLTESALDNALTAIRCSFPGKLAERLPPEHPLHPFLLEDSCACMPATGREEGRTMLTVDNAVVWFAFKKMLPDSKLSDYVGRNEKTKVDFCSLPELLMRGHDLVTVHLQHIEHGRPLRTKDEQTENAMLAYYFKKQEDQKVAQAATEDMHAEKLAWADPHALKRHMQAVPGIQLQGNLQR